MPNKYEREIEEILRNLETTEPKPGLGQKFGERLRRKPVYHPKTRRPSMPAFGTSGWLLFVAVSLALLAGGYAYATQTPNTITGLLALIGMACLVCLMLSSFLLRSASTRLPFRSGTTPVHRSSTLNSLRTRWNLYRLKMRYRRRNGRS